MKTLARLGRRRSISRSKVRSPARAQVAARFKAVVLLPSPALALVMSKVTIGPCRSAMPSRLARTLRYASASSESGTAGVHKCPPRCVSAVRLIRGTTPRSGSVSPWVTCSGTLTEWSICSSMHTNPIPSARLATIDSARSTGRLGLMGTVGSDTLAGIRT
jgi:hypothetical protein